MAGQSGRKGKLFYKFLFILLMVSLVPLAIAGYYMFGLSVRTLKRSTLSDQQALAAGLTDTVYNYVVSFRNIVYDSSRLDAFQKAGSANTEVVLNRIMQTHAALLELSLVDASGREISRVGRFVAPNTPLRDLSGDPAFIAAMKRGEYMGSLERYLGQYPSMAIAIQVAGVNSANAVGVLLARLSLNGLSGVLKTGFPDPAREQAIVVSSEGFLIAHSDTDAIFRPDAKLPQEILDILLKNAEKAGSGEVLLPDGKRELGAFAEVKTLGWVVYVQRSMEGVTKASGEILSKAAKALVLVIVFVVLLSYLISLFISQPVLALRDASIKLGEGNFDDLPQLRMPDDEIGELGQTFMQMSESLKSRTQELVAAKDELQKLNRSLESRVEARSRELKAAQDELINKERLAAIGQMSSIVGHEIRNPLAVINNSAYFIKNKMNLLGIKDPKMQKHISIIESEIQQANGIINEILGFARTRELMLKPQQVNAYIEDLVSTYPFPPHVEVVKSFIPVEVWVNIDIEEMKQAIRNVIGNAVEVMPESGQVFITTEVAADNMVKIEIRDTGPGIPPEVLAKIFNPFFTTKARGTGLGLAVVKKVVERHKGRVEVDTGPGKGTAFRLFVPVYRGALS